MATKIIKALVDGIVQNIEVEEMTSPEQPLSYDERIDTLEDKHSVVFTDGNFLVGNGTTELEEITPKEALSHIGGANIETMTTAEFETLEETNANTLYMLTDSEDDYMAKSVYDTDGDGVVDNAAKLGGKLPDDYMPAKNIAYNAETIDSLTTFAMRNASNTATDSLSVACKAAYGTALWFMFSIAQTDACVQYAFPYGTKNGFLMRNYNWWTDSWSSWESVVPASGGTFTGELYAHSANRTATCLRNIVVKTGSADGTPQSTNAIIMVRK